MSSSATIMHVAYEVLNVHLSQLIVYLPLHVAHVTYDVHAHSDTSLPSCANLSLNTIVILDQES